MFDPGGRDHIMHIAGYHKFPELFNVWRSMIPTPPFMNRISILPVFKSKRSLSFLDNYE